MFKGNKKMPKHFEPTGSIFIVYGHENSRKMQKKTKIE